MRDCGDEPRGYGRGECGVAFRERERPDLGEERVQFVGRGVPVVVARDHGTFVQERERRVLQDGVNTQWHHPGTDVPSEKASFSGRRRADDRDRVPFSGADARGDVDQA